MKSNGTSGEGSRLDEIRAKIVERSKMKTPEQLDLSGEDLRSVDLRGLRLNNIIFSDFHMNRRSNLSNANFANCIIEDTNFSGAILTGAVFRRSTLTRCNFDYCEITDSTFKQATMRRPRFRESSLRWCDFRYSNIENATFQDANMEGCDFYRSSLREGNVFEGAQIIGVSLYNANFLGAALRKDNFRGGLLQENVELFRKYHMKWYEKRKEDEFEDYKMTVEKIEEFVHERYEEAMLVYRSLNGLWVSKGFLGDANWAFVKSKKMETKTYSPRYSWRIYGKADSGSANRLKSIRTAIRYLPKYIINSVFDAICGFGESLSKVLVSMMILLFGGGFFFLLSKGVINADDRALNTNLLDNLLFSFGNFTATSYCRFLPASSEIEMAMSIQSFLGIALIGLFGFILGNKIRNS